MGSTSWEAYSVGFVLVGSVVFFAGIGWWLDSRLGTNYWLPVLFLVGVGAGFRELFRTVQRLQRDQETKKREAAAARPSAPPSPRKEAARTPGDVGRERSFQVPPPPFLNGEETQSYEKRTKRQGLDEYLDELLHEGEEEPPQDGSNK